MSTDAKYLRAAVQAAQFSNDPSTQVGAVIVDDKGVFTRGYNHLPGYTGLDIRTASRQEKMELVVCAEREAILNVAASPRKASGTTMYATWYACPGCAINIITAGIKRVVGIQRLLDLTPRRWLSEVGSGLEILRRGGVQCDWYADELDEGLEILFNEKVVTL